MININLLDWREKIRVVNNTRFYILTGAVVIAAMLLALSVTLIINGMIDGEESNIKYLDGETAAIAGKIVKVNDLQKQKDTLLSRRAVIESLQQSAPFVVRILDNLARAVPDGVVIKTLTRTENQLVIIGNGDSNSQISMFMKNIGPLKWVKSYKLNDITTAKPADSGSNLKDKIEPVNTKIDFQLNVELDPTMSGGKNEGS